MKACFTIAQTLTISYYLNSHRNDLFRFVEIFKSMDFENCLILANIPQTQPNTRSVSKMGAIIDHP